MSDSSRDHPVWVELSSTDVAGSRDYYSRLFGWDVQVSPDPQYGGYAIAWEGGDQVAGIGPQQQPGVPSAWGVYIGSDDVDATGRAVEQAGGTVLAGPFDVGDQGRMAVFADPTGAVISGWQAGAMRSFGQGRPNTFGWAELTTRDLDGVLPFYERVFGWGARRSGQGSDGEYVEFQHDGGSIAGALPMPATVPAGAPNYWAVYFNAADLDAIHRRAIELGGQELVAPRGFAGGRFSVVSDPQGAPFGLLQLAER